MSRKAKSTPAAVPAAPYVPTPWLGVLVFLTGGVILVLEIVGARLISPVYGSSLYVWSSLITVTLLALACGYEVGGRLADRYPPHRTLEWLLGVAAVFILLTPSLRKPVLAACASLGLQAGALAAAALLLLVPLLLLAAAGLVVARAVTASLDRLGRGVGRISFYSTLGSVAGALATGFVLIPRFGVSQIFYGAGVAILAGLVLVELDRRRVATAAARAVIVFVAGAIALARPEAVRADTLYSGQSFYGTIRVVEDYPHRYLLVDGIHQSQWNVVERENVAQYVRALEVLGATTKGGRALVIGLGAGTLPVLLERHYGMIADSVEIDPAIVAVARGYFEFATKGQNVVEDGRTFIARCPSATYDVVVLDTFHGDTVPHHLLTREFFADLRRVLRPGGRLAINSVTLVLPAEHSSPEIRALASTLQSEFPVVRVFANMNDGAASNEPSLVNVLLFASPDPIELAATDVRQVSRPMVEHVLRGELPAAALTGGQILTDDYNPIDLLHAATAQLWRDRNRDTAFEG